jgi:hypothetical protein
MALSGSADAAYTAVPSSHPSGAHGHHDGLGGNGANSYGPPGSSPFHSGGGPVGAAAAGGGLMGNASSADISEQTVAAVAAAASAAAAAAAAAVVAAAGQQVQSYLNLNPPPGFPFFGMPPAVLAQLSASAVAGNPAIAGYYNAGKQDAAAAPAMELLAAAAAATAAGSGLGPAGAGGLGGVPTPPLPGVLGGDDPQSALRRLGQEAAPLGDILAAAGLPLQAAAAMAAATGTAVGAPGFIPAAGPLADPLGAYLQQQQAAEVQAAAAAAAGTPPERDEGVDRGAMMEETGTTEGSQGSGLPGGARNSDGDRWGAGWGGLWEGLCKHCLLCAVGVLLVALSTVRQQLGQHQQQLYVALPPTPAAVHSVSPHPHFRLYALVLGLLTDLGSVVLCCFLFLSRSACSHERPNDSTLLGYPGTDAAALWQQQQQASGRALNAAGNPAAAAAAAAAGMGGLGLGLQQGGMDPGLAAAAAAAMGGPWQLQAQLQWLAQQGGGGGGGGMGPPTAAAVELNPLQLQALLANNPLLLQGGCGCGSGGRVGGDVAGRVRNGYLAQLPISPSCPHMHSAAAVRGCVLLGGLSISPQQG